MLDLALAVLSLALTASACMKDIKGTRWHRWSFSGVLFWGYFESLRWIVSFAQAHWQ